MKKLIALLFLFSPSVALADITQKFTTSAQISVDMPYSVTNKLGTTYSISGNNITPSVTSGGSTTSGAIGGLNIGSLTAGVPAMIQTDKAVTTAGSLSMTSLSSGVHTCAAGGSGTSCIGSTTVTITID
jgi:hypothetical protein